MRLIDADVLEQRCNEMIENEWNKNTAPYSWAFAYEQFVEDLEDAPEVDAADVLRNQWISVNRLLPATEDEVLVLTMSKNGNINVDKGYFANGRFVHRGSAKITHWMPLPEPPEEVLI